MSGAVVAPARTRVSEIARLAGPLVLSAVAGLGAQLVVLGLIGRIGDAALYVRSVYTPAAFLFLAVSLGLGVSAQVVTARCHGRGADHEIAGRLTGLLRVGLLLYPAVGACLLVAVLAFGDLLAVAPQHRGLLALFLAAMTAAGAVGLVAELHTAVLRGLGRGGPATLVMLAQIGLVVAVVAAVGLAAGVGLLAVPLAVALAGATGTALAVARLRRLGVPAGLASTAPAGSDSWGLVRRIGLPVAGAYLVLFVVNGAMLRIVAPAGEHAVAGFAAGHLVQTAVVVPGIGFGSAVAVLMNHQLAAGHRAAALGVLRAGLAMVVAAYAVVTVALVVAGRRVVAPLSANPDVVDQAWRYVSVVGPTFGCTAVVLTVLTVLEHLGRGPLALTMTTSYFGAVVLVGAVSVAVSGDVANLYRTAAVAAVASVLLAPVVGYRAVRS